MDEQEKETELTGIGGWLIFPIIGLFISPFLIFFNFINLFLPIFTDETIALLTTKGSEYYVPGLSALLFFEILGNLLLLFGSIYLLVSLFKKFKSFPIHFIYFRLFLIVFLSLDLFFAYILFPSEPVFDLETSREFFRSIIATIIWVPYMLYSKRVKNTFVY